jgi:hypothetical protein
VSVEAPETEWTPQTARILSAGQWRELLQTGKPIFVKFHEKGKSQHLGHGKLAGVIGVNRLAVQLHGSSIIEELDREEVIFDWTKTSNNATGGMTSEGIVMILKEADRAGDPTGEDLNAIVLFDPGWKQYVTVRSGTTTTFSKKAGEAGHYQSELTAGRARNTIQNNPRNKFRISETGLYVTTVGRAIGLTRRLLGVPHTPPRTLHDVPVPNPAALPIDLSSLSLSAPPEPRVKQEPPKAPPPAAARPPDTVPEVVTVPALDHANGNGKGHTNGTPAGIPYPQLPGMAKALAGQKSEFLPKLSKLPVPDAQHVNANATLADLVTAFNRAAQNVVEAEEMRKQADEELVAAAAQIRDSLGYAAELLHQLKQNSPLMSAIAAYSATHQPKPAP